MNAVTPVVTSNQSKHILKEHTRRELDQCGHLISMGNGRFALDIICNSCAVSRKARGEDCGTPIMHQNIGGYNQKCALCSTVIHEGQSPDWPELFSGRREAANG